jgi:hypothetical protein
MVFVKREPRTFAPSLLDDCASTRQDFNPIIGFIADRSSKLDELAYVFFVALHCCEWLGR